MNLKEVNMITGLQLSTLGRIRKMMSLQNYESKLNLFMPFCLNKCICRVTVLSLKSKLHCT